MSLARGWAREGRYVCRDCATAADREGLRCNDRTASGRRCDECGRDEPFEARVRLLPDGARSTFAPEGYADGERVVLLERSEAVLIQERALVYIDIGCSREVGVSVTPGGKVRVWVHDDPYSDAAIPSAEWEYDPAAAPVAADTETSE